MSIFVLLLKVLKVSILTLELLNAIRTYKIKNFMFLMILCLMQLKLKLNKSGEIFCLHMYYKNQMKTVGCRYNELRHYDLRLKFKENW